VRISSPRQLIQPAWRGYPRVPRPVVCHNPKTELLYQCRDSMGSTTYVVPPSLLPRDGTLIYLDFCKAFDTVPPQHPSL